ncbi:MAG: complex I subunit 5 family protein [Wenzhouxiangella sp.]
MMAHVLFWTPFLAVIVSALTGLVIFAAGERHARLRIILNLLAAVLKLVLVALIGLLVLQGHQPEFRVSLVPGLALVLRADALSLLFASLSAVLWLVTTVYAIAYLERSPNRARFFGFFSLCVTATMGISMAGNLLTFFIFYELLTLTTWPLVVHTGTAAAIRSGGIYLRYTLSGGALFLIGLIWLYGITGPQTFTPGGTLVEHADSARLSLQIIFVLLTVGMGVKAALFPLHAWLPAAMVAPAPVSALLHAVAVVKAGAFGLIRLVEDVYGSNLVADLGLDMPLMLIASFTILYGSVQALRQIDLKKRLAYSTVSQVSYIILGIAIGGPVATIGGLVHLVHQGLMKIILFFCAGIFANLLGVKRIDQLDGIGRRMPWTSTCFTIGALGMVGLPPVAGFVSKWYLGTGAVADGRDWIVAVLVVSTLLNASYFLPVLKRIWLHPPPEQWPAEVPVSRIESGALVGSAIVAAVLALGVGLLAGHPLSPLNWVEAIVTEYGP